MHSVSNRAHVRIVQSPQNARVKELRGALRKGEKSKSGLIALEGLNLVEEALRSGLHISTLFVRTGSLGLLDNFTLQAHTEILELPSDLFASIVTTESPQPIAALAQAPDFRLESILKKPGSLIVVSAGLQDPGNLGTIVRSTEAFGGSGVVTLPGTVSIWNAKALRASSGSAFRLPVVAASCKDLFPALRSHQVRAIATTVDDANSPEQLDMTRPIALFIGNEGTGLSNDILSLCDERITIPSPGPVESLNAAMAASILLYEASRQRRTSTNR